MAPQPVPQQQHFAAPAPLAFTMTFLLLKVHMPSGQCTVQGWSQPTFANVAQYNNRDQGNNNVA